MDGNGQQQSDTPWRFTNEPDSSAPAPAAPHHASRPIEWTASEFIAHDKSAAWYAWLILIAVVLAALVYLFTKDKISTGMVVFVAAILGIAGSRKPRVVAYSLDHSGVHVDGRFHSYDEFKAFAVQREGAFSSIMLLPLKRFMPGLSIYYDPQDEAKIFDALSANLPMQAAQTDLLDVLMHRIRF